MKFFVSSRMLELFVERKTAIEVIHFAGHTPLYIETEPIVKDLEARATMLSLLSDSEAFLSLHYLSEGQRDEEILDNHTPIEFELVEFIKLHPHRPILLFQQTPDQDVTPSPNMVRFFRHKAESLKKDIIKFQGPAQLHERLLEALSHYKSKKDDVRSINSVVIRYLGPDFIGLVGKISEVIFTKHGLNIDYISHASRPGHATLCLSCSPRKVGVRLESTDVEVMRTNLIGAIEKELHPVPVKRQRKTIRPNSDFQLAVNLSETGPLPPQFFVEIRTINAPGQLNAICKVLRNLKFNIDDLQLRPTAPEYPRQSSSVWWLSKPSSNPHDLKTDLASIEAALQYLVGVRAFSIKSVERDR